MLTHRPGKTASYDAKPVPARRPAFIAHLRQFGAVDAATFERHHSVPFRALLGRARTRRSAAVDADGLMPDTLCW